MCLLKGVSAQRPARPRPPRRTPLGDILFPRVPGSTFACEIQFMRSLRKIALIGFIALLVLLPLHEIVDPGEEWPFDDEIAVVLYSALFIAAVFLTGRASTSYLFTVVRAAARYRLNLNNRIHQSPVSDVEPSRDEPLAHLALCQFRI